MEVKIPLSLDEVWALVRLVPVGQINTVVVESDIALAAAPTHWMLTDWGRGIMRRSIDWTEAMLHEMFHVESMRAVKIITRRGNYLFDRADRYIFVNDTEPYVTPQHLVEMGIIAGRYEWVF
jgi:hypothetical protein